MTYLPNIPADIFKIILNMRGQVLLKEKKEREEREEKQDEWISDNAHDITGSSFMDQEEEEWGTKCLCLGSGLYLEFNGDKYRFNWINKKEVEYVNRLWIIMRSDNCEFITDTEPPNGIFEEYEDYNEYQNYDEDY